MSKKKKYIYIVEALYLDLEDLKETKSDEGKGGKRRVLLYS